METYFIGRFFQEERRLTVTDHWLVVVHTNINIGVSSVGNECEREVVNVFEVTGIACGKS